MLFFVNLIALLLTMSRTALFGLSVIFIVSIIRIKGYSSKVIKRVPIILFVIILYLFYISDETNLFLLPFQRLSETKALIDRSYYWEGGLRTFIANPIFGGGTEGLSQLGGGIQSAHIAALSILAKYGLIGFAIYSIFLLYPLYYVKKNRLQLAEKYNFLITAMYFSILVMYMAYDFFPNLEFQYLMFGLTYSIILNRTGIANNSLSINGLPEEKINQ